MSDNTELEWQDQRDSPDSSTGDSSATGEGARPKKGFPGLIPALVVFCLLGGSSAAWFLLSRTGVDKGATEARPIIRETLLSPARAQHVIETRHRMREEFRSSHNQNLVGESDTGDMLGIALRGELTLISGLFQHYVQTTASFFELGRIVTNNYVENRAQAEQLFLSQVKPSFEMAERRREILGRRISHYPAVGLYDNLAYIAYHDSIAVSHLERFVQGGEVEEFVEAVEYANTAKLMLRDYWTVLQLNLREYKIGFDPPEGIWRRYFIAWDIVE